jgi:hypothetical protein
MGVLIDNVGISMLLSGDGLADAFKNNSEYFYNSYLKSSDSIKNINIKDIMFGYFYHFHYRDDSNWMRWSPVFVTNYKKVYNKIIIFAINLNFIPIEVKVNLFDKYITEKDIEMNNQLKISYEEAYNVLKSVGFEYALVEYDASHIELVHRISHNELDKFLVASHPKNKYDSGKLYDIWTKKLKDKNQRDKEMMSSTIQNFYDTQGEISKKYVLLKDHIKRIQTNMKKYG